MVVTVLSDCSDFTGVPYKVATQCMDVTHQQLADLSQFTEETGRQDHNEQTGGDGRNFILQEKQEQKIYSARKSFSPVYSLNV